jgi:hypothetical protein
MFFTTRPETHWIRFVFNRVPLLAFCLVISLNGCRRSDSVNTDPSPDETPVSLTPEDAALNKEKQKYIWLTEHVTFELEHKFGSALTDAIRSTDVNVVDSFLLSSATGTLPDFDLSSFEQSGISEVACSDTRMEANRVEVLQAILNIPKEFDSIDSVKMQVLSIRGPASDETEWTSSFLLTLSGQRQDKATHHESVHQISFTVDEPKEIGQTPFISEWIIGDIIMRRSGSRLFREATSQYELDRLPLGDNWKLEAAATLQYRFQTAVADFNQDGFPDIVIADYSGERILLASVEGQSFRRVDQQLGIRNCWPERYVALAAWIDYDNDGFPDLLLGKSIYHNEQGKRFRDVTRSTNIVINREPMGAAVADFDVDGDLDVYIVYQYPNTQTSQDDGKPKPWIGDEESGGANQLWRNNSDGTFTEVADQTGATGGKRRSFAANWLYYDSDHYPDLYVANDFGNNSLLINNGDGTFSEQSQLSQTADYATSMGVVSGHLDSDGYPEIYVSNMYSKMGRRIIGQLNDSDYPPGVFEQIKGSCASNRLYSRQASESGKPPGFGAFDNSIELGINDVGWAYGSAITDFDGNGWADIYAATGFYSRDRGKPDG